MPLLFQHRIGIENRAMHPTCLRKYLGQAQGFFKFLRCGGCW